MGEDKKPDEERKPTTRVVLRRAFVLEVPDNVDGEKLADAKKALGIKATAAPVEAWVECGRFVGTKQTAIEQHAGKPGTADAKPGAYRAPTLTAWKGATEYVKPDAPLVQRRMFE